MNSSVGKEVALYAALLEGSTARACMISVQAPAVQGIEAFGDDASREGVDGRLSSSENLRLG